MWPDYQERVENGDCEYPIIGPFVCGFDGLIYDLGYDPPRLISSEPKPDLVIEGQ